MANIIITRLTECFKVNLLCLLENQIFKSSYYEQICLKIKNIVLNRSYKCLHVGSVALVFVRIPDVLKVK